MSPTKNLQIALLLTLIASILGGSVPVSAKIALESLPPFTLVTLRFVAATLFLLPFIVRRHELNLLLFRQLFKVSIIGALNPILLFIALPFTKASVTPLIYAIVPSLTAIYLVKQHQHRLEPKQWLGIVLGFVGVSIIVLLPLIHQTTQFAIYGNLLIFTAALAFCAYGIISKQKLSTLRISPLALTFYFSLVSLLLSLPFSAYELFHQGLLHPLEIHHLLHGIYIGVFGAGIFYLVYQLALKNGNAITASLFTYLQPVATIALAIPLLGEAITLPFIVGGTIAIIGSRLASSK